MRKEVTFLKKSRSERNPLLALLFLGYAALMVYLLFTRNRIPLKDMPYWEQVKDNCNFVFLRTVGNYWDVLTRPDYYVEKWGTYAVYRYHARFAFINLLGNVAMFVPLGAFLPTMWAKLRKAWKVLCVAFGMIVIVESVQLLTLRGRCDVDDLALNLAGIILGYALWRLIHYFRHRRK